MTAPTRLPDAMPDVKRRTLFAVCDSHHCRILAVGDHTIMEQETIASAEPEYSDRQGTKYRTSTTGKGGMSVGVGESDQVEEHRLKEFANTVVKRLEAIAKSGKIERIHLSAPAKALSVLRTHLTPALTKLMVQTIEGNFLKEPAMDVLARFRPDLGDAVKTLRDQENFSSKKHLPK